MQHTPFKLALSALGLGIIFDALLYKAFIPGINILLLQISFFLVLYLLTRYFKQSISKEAIVSGIFALLFSGVFAIWTSEISLALCGMGLFLSNVLTILFVWGHHGKFTHPIHVVTDAISYAAETVFTRLSILSHIRIPLVQQKYTSVVRGLIIATPVVIIFFLLFLSSDLILQQQTSEFGDWLQELFEWSSVFSQGAIILFFGLFFLLVFAAAFWKNINIRLPKTLSNHSEVESVIILIASNALFLAFIAYQAFYLFGGQKAFDQIEGITYSEYAVNGFNELAVVAVLVLLLVITLRYFHGIRSSKKLLHIAEIGLIVETLAILLSAWMRMHLYVAEYGYSPARLFGFWFFITTAIILILLAVHIYKKISQEHYMHQALILLGCAILVFIVMTPDALAVRLNVSRAQETGQIDPFPLFNQLSAEAYGVMDEVLTSDEYDLGLTGSLPEDYCPLIIIDKSPGSDKIMNFRLSITDDEYPELTDDLYFYRGVVEFRNRWNGEPLTGSKTHFRNADWRSWNLAQALLPDETQECLVFEEYPYMPEEIANACGWYIGEHMPNTETE